MNKLLSFFLSVSSLLVISSRSVAAPTEITIILSGGYNSCSNGSPLGIGMYPSFQKLIKNLRASTNVRYLVSCFESSPPPNGNMPFVISEDIRTEKSGDSADLRKFIETTYGDREGNQVYLIGHSYGGWLAMYLAQNLKMSAPIAGLFSVDPIGPKCGPMEVVFGDANCRSAPKDLDNKAIKSHVGVWANFYQDQDSWLHSSAIPEAKNFRIGYYGPHTEIDSDTRTWSEIETSIKGTL